MKFVKVTSHNINYFVDVENTSKLLDLKENFDGVIETTASGAIKEYTVDEYKAFIGFHDNKQRPEDIFNISTMTDSLADKKGK